MTKFEVVATAVAPSVGDNIDIVGFVSSADVKFQVEASLMPV